MPAQVVLVFFVSIYIYVDFLSQIVLLFTHMLLKNVIHIYYNRLPIISIVKIDTIITIMILGIMIEIDFIC